MREFDNLKKCRCGSEFKQFNTTQTKCLECVIANAEKKSKQRDLKKKQIDSMAHREAKKAQLTASDWTKKVDAVYNPFIRARDEKAGLPCPSCLRYDHEIPDTPFGKWDCGHYLSKGSHPELRWVELNTWRQCKKCNGGSGKYAKKNHTVSQTYRLTLIEWIGLEKVEWLESKHPPNHYKIPDLIELERIYKAKLKELKP
jgi:Bacteriophage Lambda NinG protein